MRRTVASLGGQAAPGASSRGRKNLWRKEKKMSENAPPNINFSSKMRPLIFFRGFAALTAHTIFIWGGGAQIFELAPGAKYPRNATDDWPILSNNITTFVCMDKPARNRYYPILTLLLSLLNMDLDNTIYIPSKTSSKTCIARNIKGMDNQWSTRSGSRNIFHITVNSEMEI